MMDNEWLWLQIFAGEGSGGDGAGADSGESGAAAGHARLQELGVPADKIRKNVNYNIPAPAKAPAESAPQEAPADEQDGEQPTTAEETTPETEPTAAKRMTWDEIMADPEYNKQMQAVVQGRLRDAKGKAESFDAILPGLEVLARRMGMDPAKIDYKALSDSIEQDANNYEDTALAMGVSAEEARNRDIQQRNADREQRAQEATLEEQRIQEHIRNLETQGEILKAKFPDFDLRTELQNPVFARMTSPSGGVPVEAAYIALHHQEIQSKAMSLAAQKTAESVSKSIQAGAKRPDEAGTSAQAPSVTSFNVAKASKEQREALRRRIMAGEKIYPGHEF